MQSPDVASGTVLVVGSGESCEFLDAIAGHADWQWAKAATANEALWRLRQENNIDAVVMLTASDPKGCIELCRHLKLGLNGAFVTAVFVLSPELIGMRSDVYRAGAEDCIEWPADPQEVVMRLRHAIRLKQATDSLEDATTVITALANAIEGKDAYTCGHVERVATYSVEIGRRVGVEEADVEPLRIGALVHDIGKVAVPDHILNKPGRLTQEEMEIIKKHPVVGCNILERLRTFRQVVPIVRWHHEKPNGRGYPDGLTDLEIPMLPRIVAVADCFDALSTDRPYRPGLPLDECRQILINCGEQGDLDPKLVGLMFEIIEENTASVAAHA